MDLAEFELYKKYTPPVLYLCDREACGADCSYPSCKHTSDVRHAVNFKEIGDAYWEGADETCSNT